MTAEQEQLAALAALHEGFEQHGIEYWLFGGWAVDLHAGSVTRSHEDLDVAVWRDDQDRIAALLAAEGWKHSPQEADDGYTAYERSGVRLEMAFLARGGDGEVYTPLREGRASWPDDAFGDDVAELLGARARVVTLAALKEDKSAPHEDPLVAAKDRADVATLAGLG